jgi:cell wall-associated NlpC family hydrolase
MRERIVAEARSWLGTRYQRGGMIKCDPGKPWTGGVDCATLLYCIYRACGLMDEDPKAQQFFSDDWFFNTKEEHYFSAVLRHIPKFLEGWAFPTTKALPGSLVLSKCVGSKVFNHGGIVTAWPRVIHAAELVTEIDITHDPLWQGRPIAIFDPLSKESA